MEERNYKMDNLKTILIFLVVFAHFLEIFMIQTEEDSLSVLIYKIIYIFHMPFFVFISGYFSKFSLKNIIKKYLYPFIILQTIYSFVFEGAINFVKPYWILWYLFSLIIWVLTIPIVKKYCKTMFFLSVVLALLCGYINIIGYEFSLSRLFCFYPFFIMGNIIKDKDKDKDKDNKEKINFINNIFILILIFLFLYFFIFKISLNELYMSCSYKISGGTIFSRFLIIILAFLFIYSGMVFIPNKKNIILSKIGKNTLPIFLFHGIFIKIVAVIKYPFLFFESEYINIILAFIMSIVLIVILSSSMFFKIIRPFVDFDFWDFRNK